MSQMKKNVVIDC